VTRPDDACRPDYAGGGIVNLMASLVQARGGTARAPEARLLPARELGDIPQIVLLVIDGLGADWLDRHAPRGLLSQHRLGTLTSVFPTATAPAITTFLTGVAPGQHGVTGWFVWLRELGCVLKILSGQPRYGGADYRQARLNVRALCPQPALFDDLAVPAAVVSPREIARSPFNLAHLGRDTRLYPCAGFGDLCRQIERALRAVPAPGYVYAYWPKLDALGHRHGIASPAAVAHLRDIERHLDTLRKRVAGRGVALLVSADHGQIDTAPAATVELAAHPRLAATLRLPLCGEPRAAFCYPGLAQAEAFVAYCDAQLAAAVTVWRGADAIAQRLFGPGPVHPELSHRIGDFVLTGRGAWIVRDRLPTEEPFVQIGVHGGLSRAEMLVPLCRL